MFVSCVSNLREIGDPASELILFPEYADLDEIKLAASNFPDSFVAGAIKTGRRSRGLLLHRGRNRIDYLKVGTDDITEGTGIMPPLPVYEFETLCVGVVICMDVQVPELVRNVVARVARSASKHKIVCIPAYMDSSWFTGPTLDANFRDVHVALCNHTHQDRPRCKSFIASPDRCKIHEQHDIESLHAELTSK